MPGKRRKPINILSKAHDTQPQKEDNDGREEHREGLRRGRQG